MLAKHALYRYSIRLQSTQGSASEHSEQQLVVTPFECGGVPYNGRPCFGERKFKIYHRCSLLLNSIDLALAIVETSVADPNSSLEADLLNVSNGTTDDSDVGLQLMGGPVPGAFGRFNCQRRSLGNRHR